MAQVITLLAGGVPSPQGVILPAGTQIQFNNQSGQSVTINYTNQGNQNGLLYPTFTQNPIPNGGSSGVLSPNYANGAMNYTVTPSGGTASDPYAVQLGSGYMIVVVTNNNAEPDPIAIPYWGNLQIISANMNQQYDLTWVSLNPFGPGNMGETSSGVYGAQALYTGYTLSPQPGGAPGGGKVIIRSS